MNEVMVVEDNLVASKLIAEVVAETGFHCGRVCRSAEIALEALRSGYAPDINLPRIDGISAVPLIKESRPDAEIIIQTVFEDPDTIVRAIRAGVSGYILKGTGGQEFARALREVVEGGSPLSPIVARKVLRAFQYWTDEGETSVDRASAPLLSELTGREREILEKLIQGFSYRDIGFELGISVNTVNSHLRKIYEKLRVNSRAEAVGSPIRSG